ncbi:MAG: Hpt protein [Rhodospirillales bacterium]|jgi:signal transduction histidine kinase/CheY-like chemotaxis protein/HPt (histidine-containing phosphotransfer) domain-containing protein|nr:Hpt protein [Rhodospirillales bacterium]MDB5380834.1 Hpt protein [Rhodospirillales bacterium]
MLQSSRLLRIGIFLAAGALLLAQLVATAVMVGQAREAQETASRETVERVASGVETSINRAFVQVDAMLAALPAVLAPFARDGVLDVGTVNRLLQEMNNQSFTYRDVLLLQNDGVPIAAALPLSRRRRLSKSLQEDFAQVMQHSGTVSFGGPVKNPVTGEWSLYFARSLNIPGIGPVLGVAEVPLPLVQTLLAVGGDRSGLRVTLETVGGKLMASVPPDELRIGRNLPQGARDWTSNDRNLSVLQSRFASSDVFALVRPTLYPALVVATTFDVDVALADWYRDRRRAWLVSGAFGVLLIVIATALSIVQSTRQRAENERARARGTLESALESMSDGFVMFDAQDRLVACNSRYKDFYRVSAPLIVPGAHFEEILREGARLGQYPQVGPDIDAFVRRTKEFHRGDKPPMERLLPDGRWVLITERRTPDGGTVGIRTEITALKVAMVELAAARDTAAAAGAARMAFLARMSHELRTPLNGILGFAQVLVDDSRLTEDQREHVRIVHGAGAHLLALVNGLLDLSKIEAGRMELTLRPVRLHHLLGGCVALLRTEAVRKTIELRMDFDPGLPVAVMVDPTRLRQMMLNLMSNAVKFTPVGGVVTLAVLPLPEGELRFEVRDTGPGIDVKQRERLFQDFVQLAGVESDAVEGTGLGLAITAQLAAMMGGRIGCDGAPGGGSVFWIEIPLRQAEPPAPALSALPRPAVRSMRLLVVDDIAANREVARALLRSDGHIVETASDGAKAIKRVAMGGIDAVLMDLQMPEMDGLEATRRIRAMPAPVGQVPVLAVTASALPEQIEACRAAGMDGHLAKPIERHALAQALADLRLAPGSAEASGDGAAPDVAVAPVAPALFDGVVLDGLRRELGEEIAAEIIGEFRAELDLVRGQLDDVALDAEEAAPLLRQLAHRALGAARNLGAERLAEKALALELAARDGKPVALLRLAVVAVAADTAARIEAPLSPAV